MHHGRLHITANRRARRPRSIRRPSVEGLERRDLLTTYAVGPGETYSTIGAVPWNNLQPGDTVDIYWKSTPYNEKILMSASGTAAAPISIVGIPGPNGQKPIIDGANATTSSQFQYSYDPLQEDSLLLIARSANQAYAYKPSYINVEGLEFRNAYYTNTFTDSHGKTQNYAQFSAAIYIEGANNVTIENDTLDNSGLGLFALSNGDEPHTTRNLMVEGNSIYGNGVPGSYLEHNVYTEAVGITYQYNDFGPLRSGAAGNDLKDRSAGTVIRYNYFAPGGHILDLVDPEDDAGVIAGDPSFQNTYVYGNVLDNTGSNTATLLVHFGGDSGATATYRPHLEFYDNTVVNAVNQSSQWRTIMFQMDTNSQSVTAYNNIFYNAPATAGANATLFEWMSTAGVATFGANWVSPGWLPSYDTQPFVGSISGTSNFYSPSNNNPGFVNIAAGNYQLTSTSSAIGRGVAVSSGDPAVTEQYVAPTSETARTSTADLGAFQASLSPPPAPTVTGKTPASGATGVATSTNVTATFSVPMQGSTVALALDAPGGKPIAATLSYNPTTYVETLTPSAQLAAGTTYTAIVSAATSAAGVALAAPLSWSFTTLPASPPPPPPPPPPSGLVAAYNFDEGTGTVLHDLSGNGNNGVVSNASWATAGKFGGALSFTGSLGSWVTINDSRSLDLTKGMTLEAWVDPTTLRSPDQDWVATISKEHQNSSNDIAYALYAANGTGTPAAGHILVGSADYGTQGTSTISTKTWTFLAATYDGSTLKMYVNGTLVGSQHVGGSITTTSNPLRIGGDWSGEMFTGLIDNVRIYNVPLSQSQISAEMNTAVVSTSAAASSVSAPAPGPGGSTAQSVVLVASPPAPTNSPPSGATSSAPATSSAARIAVSPIGTNQGGRTTPVADKVAKSVWDEALSSWS
jgi:hypothetical protein